MVLQMPLNSRTRSGFQLRFPSSMSERNGGVIDKLLAISRRLIPAPTLNSRSSFPRADWSMTWPVPLHLGHCVVLVTAGQLAYLAYIVQQKSCRNFQQGLQAVHAATRRQKPPDTRGLHFPHPRSRLAIHTLGILRFNHALSHRRASRKPVGVSTPGMGSHLRCDGKPDR